jgi:hypothetical protein
MRVDIHADDPVFHGDALLGRPPKTIEPLFHDELIEAEMSEKRELCLRQSAGDSTRPQVSRKVSRSTGHVVARASSLFLRSGCSTRQRFVHPDTNDHT